MDGFLKIGLIQTELGNRRDYALRYTFSDGGDDILSWYRSYQSGNSISINAIDKDGAEGVWAKDILHHSIYANFNPLVTVTTDGNGTVTPTPDVLEDEVLIPHGENKFEATYGKNATFTITPKGGFKVKTVTANDTSITANSDGTYTLESVTEPTTLNVEFEELDTPANPDPEEPTINELNKILGNVIVHCITDGSGHEDKVFSFKDVDSDNVDGLYYEVNWTKENPTHATVTINHDPYVERYNLYTFPKSHQKAQDILETTFNLEWEDGEWKKADETASPITIQTICAPTIDEINAKLDVSVDCNNANANPEHKAMIFEDLLADSYEIGTPELSGSEYICDVTVKAEKYVTEYDKEYRPEHSNADNQIVTFKFKDGKWTLESDPTSVNFIVTCDFPNGPSEDEIAKLGLKLQLNCATTPNSHGIVKYDVTNKNTFEVSDVIYTDAADAPSHYYVNVTVDGSSYLTQYNNDKGVHSWVGSNEAVFKVYAGELESARKTEYIWNIVDSETMTLQVQHTNPTDPTDPGTNPGGNGGDNDDDDDRYTGDNTVTRTINDDDVPLNDRPTNTTTIDDEDVPLADLPDDTVTIDDGEVPLKANPSTGDSLPFAAMAAAALSLGGVIVLNRKKK